MIGSGVTSEKRGAKAKEQRRPAGTSFFRPINQWQRLGWTLAFLLIFVLRIPDVVLNPQFWSEDGSVFFRQSLCNGPAAIGQVYDGYFHLVPRLVALAAQAFRPTYSPALYCAAALILTGLVLYLVQSPRLVLSLTPLAIVLCPTGQETYGNLTNVQWYLSLAVLALVLMRPSQSKVTTILEAALIAIAGFTGPFVLLLLPLFGVGLLFSWRDQPVRSRMLILTVVASVTSCVQLYTLLNSAVDTGMRNLPPTVTGDIPLDMGAAICTHTLGSLLSWISPRLFMGLWQALTPVGWLGFLEIGVFLFVVLSTLRSPQLRFERLALLYFGSIVLLTTFYKFKDYLPGLVPGSNGARYFLIPTVTATWLLISAVSEPKVGILAKVSLALLLVSTVVGFRRDPLTDFDWPSWAHRVERGDKPRIPTNPPGWFVVTDCSLPQPRVQ